MGNVLEQQKTKTTNQLKSRFEKPYEKFTEDPGIVLQVFACILLTVATSTETQSVHIASVLGSGWPYLFVSQLPKMVSGIDLEFTGFDINPRQITYCLSNPETIKKLIQESLSSSRFGSQFDLPIGVDTIETHILNVLKDSSWTVLEQNDRLNLLWLSNIFDYAGYAMKDEGIENINQESLTEFISKKIQGMLEYFGVIVFSSHPSMNTRSDVLGCYKEVFDNLQLQHRDENKSFYYVEIAIDTIDLKIVATGEKGYQVISDLIKYFAGLSINIFGEECKLGDRDTQGRFKYIRTNINTGNES